MRENPAISDWVPISEGSTEGLLGGWLAQRHAALREVMAAGALSTFTLGLPCVPVLLEHLLCHRKTFCGKGGLFSLEHAGLFVVFSQCLITVCKKQENPVISDWVHISEGSTEGLLGGWLAQRHAALREVMAAGALSTFTLGLPCVPVLLEHLPCHRKVFVVSEED
jgi:hypothetical protein